MSHRMLTLLVLGLAAPHVAGAQERTATLPSCSGARAPVGDLGYSGLSCNCTHYLGADPDSSVWRFREEPRIEGVKAGGAAAARLRRGDRIVAIDGVLITSDEGGRRFAQVRPGEPVTLTIRRDGREQQVEITPAAACPATAAVTPSVDERVVFRTTPPPPRRADVKWLQTVPTVPPPKLASRAWLGFSLRCSQCGVTQHDSTVEWEFGEPPTVDQVEADGPAARAGLRDGDRITHMDSLAITTSEAGTRFGAIEPGQQITLRVLRESGEAATVAFVAEAHRGNLTQSVGLRGQLTQDLERFTGTIGNALVQVTGAAVSVTQTDDEIVIRSADITVRIRRTDR